MNLSYRLRLARQSLWRNRRFLWRTFEALIALFCLLATHQAVWVYFKDLSAKLRAEFPNPAVWFIPTKISSSDTLRATQAVIEVQDSTIALKGYAPPRREVILRVNDREVSRQSSLDGRLTFYEVPLRRGANTIRGEVAEYESAKPFALESELTQQRVYYRPRTPLPAKILGVFPRENGSSLVLGMTDPTAQVYARVSNQATARALYLDAYGVFQERVTQRPHERLHFFVGGDSAQSAGRDSVALSDSLDQRLTLAKVRRTLTLTIAGNAFKIYGTTNIIPGTTFTEWSTHALITPEAWLADYFGLALSCFNPWLPTAPEINAKLDTAQNQIALTVSGKIPRDGLRAMFARTSRLNDPPLLFPEDKLQIEIDDPTRLRRLPLADENYQLPIAKHHAYVWRGGRLAERTREFLLELEPQPLALAPSDSITKSDSTHIADTPRAGIIQQTRQLEDLAPKKVRDILTALLKTVPFLWLLWLLRGENQPHKRDYHATLYAATMAFFLFHFILLSLPVFSTSFSFIDPILPLFEASTAVLATVKDLGQVYPFLAIGIIFLFRPLYYTYKLRLPPPTLGRRVQRHFLRWFVFWPAVLVLPTGLFYLLVKVREAASSSAGAQPLFANYLVTGALFAGIGLLCCWIFLYWLLAVGLGQPVRIRTAIIVSWAMLLLPLLPILVEATARFIRYVSVTQWGLYPFFLPPRRDEAIWFLLIVGVGTALFYQFVELSIRLSQSRRGVAFLRSKWMWGLIPFFILLSLPMNYVLNVRPQSTIDIGDLNALASGIASLLPAALLLGLITFLRKVNPEDQFELRSVDIGIGTILFAYYLTGRNTSLLFAPILLFLGWLVFTRWALVERVSVAPPASAFALQDLVRKLLEYKQARQLAASLQRNLEKKYTQGDLTLVDLQAKIKDSQAHVAKSAEALPANETTVKQQIFGHGPELGPWANARTALRYGLLLSLPFQANTFANILKRQSFENFPLLQVLNALVASMTTWFLIAFVFGYFFHKIRGRDGFAKAFVFATALLISTIPLRFIDAKPLLEQGFVVQIVQILAYVLLLALIAFDLRTLQKLNFTWRDLLTVHGFTTITAYGSSIALATLASLSGPQWISFVGKFINLLLGASTSP